MLCLNQNWSSALTELADDDHLKFSITISCPELLEYVFEIWQT